MFYNIYIYCLLNFIILFLIVVTYAQFVPYAIVDGRKRTITFSLVDSSAVSASLPHFWDAVGMFYKILLNIIIIII